MAGSYGDTMQSCMWAPNPPTAWEFPNPPFNSQSNQYPGDATPYLLAATSFHPGGVNFAFADGSGPFIQDSISSWQINQTGQFLPRQHQPQTELREQERRLPTLLRLEVIPGTSLGVYQALSTRNGGEVISSDGY